MKASGAPLHRRIAAVLAALAVSLLACEVALRVATRRDEAGQLWLGSLRLLPYELPLDQIRANLDKLRDGETFLGWAAPLGGAPGPDAARPPQALGALQAEVCLGSTRARPRNPRTPAA